jgi:hypothetical protein
MSARESMDSCTRPPNTNVEVNRCVESNDRRSSVTLRWAGVIEGWLGVVCRNVAITAKRAIANGRKAQSPQLGERAGERELTSDTARRRQRRFPSRKKRSPPTLSSKGPRRQAPFRERGNLIWGIHSWQRGSRRRQGHQKQAAISQHDLGAPFAY